MQMARAAGLTTAACGLLPLVSGELVYITLRLDRVAVCGTTQEDHLRHMEDLCQATEHLTAHKYRGSMELVARTIRHSSTAPDQDLAQLFMLTLFLFLTGNADMHLKNFSLLSDSGEQGRAVRLAPAYDLLSTRLVIPEKDDPEELALTLNGKKRRLRSADFAAFARSRLAQSLPAMLDVLAHSFLPKDLKAQYRSLILARAARLELPVPAALLA